MQRVTKLRLFNIHLAMIFYLFPHIHVKRTISKDKTMYASQYDSSY